MHLPVTFYRENLKAYLNVKKAVTPFTFLFILIFFQCQVQEKVSTVTEWLSKAVETEKFIRTAKDENENGPAWRVMPDKPLTE